MERIWETRCAFFLLEFFYLLGQYYTMIALPNIILSLKKRGVNIIMNYIYLDGKQN